MEADLQRFHRVDYRDRYRRTESGTPLLTLRRLAVLVMRGLPADSALMAELNTGPPWTRTEHLLDDLRVTVLATTPGMKPEHIAAHPDRMRQATGEGDAETRHALYMQRKKQRERRLAKGD